MLNAEVSGINMCFQLNKLSLNKMKSKCMVFRKPQKTKIPVIKIDQNELEYVGVGVNLATTISWKPRLSKVINKIVRIIGIMNKLKLILPQNIL